MKRTIIEYTLPGNVKVKQEMDNKDENVMKLWDWTDAYTDLEYFFKKRATVQSKCLREKYDVMIRQIVDSLLISQDELFPTTH